MFGEPYEEDDDSDEDPTFEDPAEAERRWVSPDPPLQLAQDRKGA